MAVDIFYSGSIAALLLATVGYLSYSLLAWVLSSEYVLLCLALAMFEFIVLGASISFMAQFFCFYCYHVQQVCRDMLNSGSRRASSRWLDLLWGLFWALILAFLFLLQYVPLTEAMADEDCQHYTPLLVCYCLTCTVFTGFLVLVVGAVWLRVTLRLQFPPSFADRFPDEEVAKLKLIEEIAGQVGQLCNMMDFVEKIDRLCDRLF